MYWISPGLGLFDRCGLWWRLPGGLNWAKHRGAGKAFLLAGTAWPGENDQGGAGWKHLGREGDERFESLVGDILWSRYRDPSKQKDFYGQLLLRMGTKIQLGPADLEFICLWDCEVKKSLVFFFRTQFIQPVPPVPKAHFQWKSTQLIECGPASPTGFSLLFSYECQENIGSDTKWLCITLDLPSVGAVWLLLAWENASAFPVGTVTEPSHVQEEALPSHGS